jgi:hypothetical protein
LPFIQEEDMTTTKANRISRRQFLFGAATVTLLTSLYTSYRHIGNYPSHSLQLNNLSDKEVTIYRIIGNWLLPKGGALPGSGGDDVSIQLIDRMLINIPEGKRELLAALPLAFEHGTLLHEIGSQALSNMPTADQITYLNEWANSSNLIRCQLLAALKTMYAFSYFEREDVLTAMNLRAICRVPST